MENIASATKYVVSFKIMTMYFYYLGIMGEGEREREREVESSAPHLFFCSDTICRLIFVGGTNSRVMRTKTEDQNRRKQFLANNSPLFSHSMTSWGTWKFHHFPVWKFVLMHNAIFNRFGSVSRHAIAQRMKDPMCIMHSTSFGAWS
jgi:hypothetical protein